MSKFFLLSFVILAMISCKSQKPNNYQFIFFKNSYNNNELYSYIYYESNTGNYKEFESTDTSKIDKKIKINLDESEILYLYKLYQKLLVKNEKFCINEREGNPESEVFIYFTNVNDNYNIKVEDLKCMKNEKDKYIMIDIWFRLLGYIRLKKEYREAFPWMFETM